MKSIILSGFIVSYLLIGNVPANASNLKDLLYGKNNEPSPASRINAKANTTELSNILIKLNMIHFQPDFLDPATLLKMTKGQFQSDQSYYLGGGSKGGYRPLFRKEQVKGKSVALTAEALVPEYRKKILEIAASAPKRFMMNHKIKGVSYDKQRGVLISVCCSKRSQAGGYFYFLAPYPNTPRLRNFPNISKAPFYSLSKRYWYSFGKNFFAKDQNDWEGYTSIKLGLAATRFMVADGIILDRWLEADGIPIKRKQAEKILYAVEQMPSSQKNIHSRVEFTVTGSLRDGGALLGKVESVTILGPNNEFIARAPGNIFSKTGDGQGFNKRHN
jgi:hypothetical protein